MTKRRSKKQALMASILSLVLCVSMLLGTTMAWFTDTVTNSGNRIEAGTLKVKLLRHDGSEYQDISDGTGDIFITNADDDTYVEGRFNGTLWEPNKTEIVYLAVENAGNLALNYNIILNVTNANADSANTAALDKVMSYAVVSGLEASSGSTINSWKDIQALNNVQTGDVPVGETVVAKNGALTADNTDYFALAVHMDENAGNEYQGTALNIDVKIVAKQMSHEEDSFGKEYDANALWVEKEEKEEEEEKFAVYFNRTFDEGANELEGIQSSVTKTNEIAVKEEESGNKYLNIVRNEAADSLFEIPVAGGGCKQMMLEFDLSSDKLGKFSVEVRGVAGGISYLVVPLADGTVHAGGSGGENVASLASGDWVKFAIALDFEAETFDVYVNRVLAVEDKKLDAADFGRVRVQVFEANPTSVKIDNIKIYEGTTIRDYVPPVEDNDDELIVGNSIMPTYEDAISNLEGKMAVHVYGDSFFANGKKTSLGTSVQMENGADSILVPASVISEGLGLAVAQSDQAVTVGDNVTMTIGSTNMTVGSESVTLAVAPKLTEGGEILLPLCDIAEKVLQKKIFWDDHGVIIISDETVELSTTQLMSVNNYLLYDHPSKEEILEKFSETSANVHPRVMVTQDTFDRIEAEYKAGGVMKEWGDEVIFKADSYLKQPLPVMNKASSTNQQLLTIPQGIKTRIEHLAVAFYLTGNGDYVDRVYSELENAANFSDWNTNHFLNTAEYITAFAIGYDWLYDEYTDEQRKVIEEALYKKGLINSYKAYYAVGGTENSGWWAKETINWNLVCNGGSIVGAVALLDVYPDIAADVMSNALKGMDFALASYYPDGVWTEGIEYWAFATEFVVRACSALTSSFGDDFNISNAKGFSTTYEMPIHINGYVAKNNYNDAEEVGGLFESSSMYWLADRFDEPGVANVRYQTMQQEDISATALDMIYCDTSQLGGENEYPVDKYLTGSELVAMRTSWSDASGTYLSFHGGNAHENHGHVDTGTFVIDMLGERIASDLGAESYSHPDYFDNLNRYNLYRARPEGHNMVVINPDTTPGISLDSFAKVETLVSEARGAYSVLDLDDAYKDHASAYKRGYKLEDDRRSAVIRDEFTLLEESNGYWFMHTQADIEIVDDTTAVLTRNNKEFLVRFATNLTDITLKEMAAEPLSTSPIASAAQIDNTALGYTKLALEFDNASGEVYIEMKVIPKGDPASGDPLTNLPIAQWSIPDGEMSVLPRADMIYANDAAIIGFDPIEQGYTVNVPAGEGVPEITVATSNSVTYDVVDASDLSETTTVKVIDGSNPGLYRYYYINFRVIDVTVGDLPGVEGATRHAVKNLFASENPQPANMDVNVLDGDLSTRWSAEGSGQWIMLDLGESQKINAFGIATFNGSTRTLSYSIDISGDGINWENIHIGVTELTNNVEVVEIEEVSARFVRLTGYGTSTGTWNSITEFATLCFE